MFEIHTAFYRSHSEAAVDKPLLYQEWGKTQTYIVAFATPSALMRDSEASSTFVWMEDVTKDYTSDSWEDIWNRRDESTDEINAAFEQATKYLTRKLQPPSDTAVSPPTK